MNVKQRNNGYDTLNVKRILTVVIASVLLTVSMVVIRHIHSLNDSIQIKQIQIQDNSAKLKLLNSKYDEINQQLNKAGTDKVKLEQQLRELEKERDSLQSQLTAKRNLPFSISARAYAEGGDAKAFIYEHESGNRLTARNSGGCLGLGQACPGSKLVAACPNWETDYACQDQFFTNYMLNRYGTWENARAMWQSRCGSPSGCWW